MKLTVENCHQVSINDLQKKVRKLMIRNLDPYQKFSDDETRDMMLGELKKFTVNDQVFDYASQSNYLGGYRWFFLCPKCNKKVSKLLLPPKGTKKEHKYLCKKCHKLKNQSVVMGQTTMYQKVTRPLKRMRQIENKIAAGHIPMDKIKLLLDEYDQLESELKNTIEYRLYMFKKKHGALKIPFLQNHEKSNGELITN